MPLLISNPSEFPILAGMKCKLLSMVLLPVPQGDIPSSVQHPEFSFVSTFLTLLVYTSDGNKSFLQSEVGVFLLRMASQHVLSAGHRECSRTDTCPNLPNEDQV